MEVSVRAPKNKWMNHASIDVFAYLVLLYQGRLFRNEENKHTCCIPFNRSFLTVSVTTGLVFYTLNVPLSTVKGYGLEDRQPFSIYFLYYYCCIFCSISICTIFFWSSIVPINNTTWHVYLTTITKLVIVTQQGRQKLWSINLILHKTIQCNFVLLYDVYLPTTMLLLLWLLLLLLSLLSCCWEYHKCIQWRWIICQIPMCWWRTLPTGYWW